MKSRNEASLTLAWEIYSHLFRIIKRFLQNDFDKLYLSQVSPELEAISQSELAVPGLCREEGEGGGKIEEKRSGTEARQKGEAMLERGRGGKKDKY
jgi:hypothetical protein